MTTLPISITCGDYPRLAPLLIGDVQGEGVDLAVIRGPRPEMLRRALTDPGMAGGEASLAGHLRRIDQGDRSFVAIPVFVQRNFMPRAIYVRKGDALALKDRPGLRVGMYSWVASGSVWYRQFLRHVGAPLDTYDWIMGPTQAADPFKPDPAQPAHVRSAPAGKGLADMLIEGEIDLLLSPSRPAKYDPANGPIVRLYPDIRATERDYFRAHRIYPPQHLIVLRRAVWEAAPWLLRSLNDAFEATEEKFLAYQKHTPFATPWEEAEIDETIALMGPHYHANGIEPNRTALEVFAEEAHRAGLASRRVGVDELFEEFLTS